MTDPSQGTKDRLLDAAEELFANQGFDQVSIRDLASAAGVNVAAVNYHFQGKENLFQEVILRRFVHQRKTTLQALEEALSQNSSPTLSQVIEALVRTFLTGALGQGQSGNFMSLMAEEMMADNRHAQSHFFREMVAPVFKSFSNALITAQPHLTQDDLDWAIASVVGQIYHFIMRWKKCQSMAAETHTLEEIQKIFPALKLPVDQYIEEVTQHITRFSSAAIEAMHSEVQK